MQFEFEAVDLCVELHMCIDGVLLDVLHVVGDVCDALDDELHGGEQSVLELHVLLLLQCAVCECELIVEVVLEWSECVVDVFGDLM